MFSGCFWFIWFNRCFQFVWLDIIVVFRPKVGFYRHAFKASWPTRELYTAYLVFYGQQAIRSISIAAFTPYKDFRVKWEVMYWGCIRSIAVVQGIIDSLFGP